MAVLIRDLTALFRWRASSFLRMRLICCLMFATGVFEPRLSVLSGVTGARGRSMGRAPLRFVSRARLTQWKPGYQARDAASATGPASTSWDDGDEPAE